MHRLVTQFWSNLSRRFHSEDSYTAARHQHIHRSQHFRTAYFGWHSIVQKISGRLEVVPQIKSYTLYPRVTASPDSYLSLQFWSNFPNRWHPGITPSFFTTNLWIQAGTFRPTNLMSVYTALNTVAFRVLRQAQKWLPRSWSARFASKPLLTALIMCEFLIRYLSLR